jgi:hypothetical protein
MYSPTWYRKKTPTYSAKLEYLELHLGIPARDYGTVLRIQKYQAAVEKALTQHPDLYCNASFQIDPWNTAKELMQWRDHLQLTFWKFNCTDPTLHRLYTLSCIEPHTGGVPKGINERWIAAYQELATSPSALPLKEITVYEAPDQLHPFFVKLLERLRQNGIAVYHHQPQYPQPQPPTTDLQLFQKRLQSSGQQPKATAKGDGSLTILKASNDFLLADGLAAYLSQAKNQPNPLLLLQGRGSLLENALIKYGFPPLGYTEELEHGAYDQLAELMTLFLWEPFDSDKLIEYLTMPDAPVHKNMRFALASAYAEKAGFENEKWIKAINDLDTKDRKKSLDQYQHWFKRDRYNRQNGAPAQAVIQLYKDLSHWALRYAHSLENPHDPRKKPLTQLAEKCKILQELCKGQTTINPTELHHWIRELKRDSTSKLHQAGLGAFNYVNHSANIVAPSSFTIWWNFIDPGNPLQGAFLPSQEEIQQLGEEHLHTVPAMLDEWYSGQTNGILNATDQLFLCIPANQSGAEVAPHPLYADLHATFSNPEILEQTLEPGSTQQLAPITSFERKGLPVNTPYWQVQHSIDISSKEYQSFSSLEKLLKSPYAYVLKYELGIQPIQIPKLKIDHQLKGNILHHAAEILWRQKDLLSQKEIELKKRIHAAMEEAYKEEGEVFLLPKNAIYKADLDNIGSASLLNNNWEIAAYEEWHENPDDHIPLGGIIDLILRRGNETAIVDLKFMGKSKRQKEIAERRAIQLLIYQRLMRNQAPGNIYLGYYLLDANVLFTQETGAFAEAIVPHSTENRTMDQLWQKVLEAFNHRLKELGIGKIEAGDKLRQKEFDFWPQYVDILLHKSDRGDTKEKPADTYGPYKTLLGK